MTALNKQALREAAEKVTALNFDTAEIKREDGCYECPACGGEGWIDGDVDYCNIDGVALGVLFYGIGEHHGLAEAYLRAANPATVLALMDELEAAEKRIAEQSAIVAAAEKLVRCKGRYHSEQNYRALAALFGVTTPDLPPLEHENVHYADAAEMEIAALRQRIAELSASHSKLRDTMAAIHNTIRMDGGYTPLAAILNAAKRAYEESASADGIGVKG
ncbi:ead/Ea22-like family protein [Citrobacter freundii]|nr:ead/Ea22-like family protein [Citrobacter freundii]